MCPTLLCRLLTPTTSIKETMSAQDVHSHKGPKFDWNSLSAVWEQLPEQGPQLPVLAPAGGEAEGGGGRGGRAQLQDQDVRAPEGERLPIRGQVSDSMGITYYQLVVNL